MKANMCIALVSALLLPFGLSAQCVKGNCYDGYGTYLYESGAKYVGQFAGGKIHGEGILYFSNGNRYIGNWVNQFREGQGKMIFTNGDVYEGTFRRSKFRGQGEMRFANGDRYVGEWQDDLQHGYGTYFYQDGDRYEGDFVAGKINGQGIMYYSDGASFSGAWRNNRKNGRGVLTKPDGSRLEGYWEEGEYIDNGQELVSKVDPASGDHGDLPNCNKVYCASGKGVLTYTDGSRYVGEFEEGNPKGEGTCFYSNGDKYVGEWAQHSPHGEGIMYYADGRVLGAIWEHGRPVREIEPREEVPSVLVNQDKDARVKIWAVIVGVARYNHMPVLKYTDDDAYQIYAFLKSPQGGALYDDQIRVLIDEDATRENILMAMTETFMKADENDVVLFYFSGHGLEGSFLPVDFDGFNNRLHHEDVKDLFDRSRAKHKVCFADACHSGSLTAMKSPYRDVVDEYYEAFDRSSGGTALLVSSKSDEYSLEDQGLRQGIFSHFLIRGLKGEANRNSDRIITIQELYDFIYTKVRNYTANVQSPSITGSYDRDMPVAVVRR